MTMLTGSAVVPRPAASADVAELARIRATPEVRRWWRGSDDLVAEITADLVDPETRLFAIEFGGRVVGAIQYSEENEPDYRHAGIDIYLDPAVHGQGLG